MTRLAENRETHLTPAEIATEALRQFDEEPSEPTIRSLATALRVAPSAIYHHFPSRSAIVQAAVEMAWSEATAGLLEQIPRPLEADPAEVLVATGLATRRAWLAHNRLAGYMAATPESNQFTNRSIGLMGALFERLGLEGEQAAAGFHTYSSFMIGAVLFAAARKTANDQLAADASRSYPSGRFESQPSAGSSDHTRLSIDEVVDVSVSDPERDEDLFVLGMRRLVESLRGDGGDEGVAAMTEG